MQACARRLVEALGYEARRLAHWRNAMLFKRALLARIQAGEVTLAFRHWVRPTVKSGGCLRTAIGELAIEEVRPVAPEAISDEEARDAGFPDRSALMQDLQTRPDGRIYRIAFRVVGSDPRVALAHGDRLTDTELASIANDLARLDNRSADGHWTHAVLSTIANHPGRRATDLAAQAHIEKAKFKRRVRALKQLGLTESLAVGYRLSTRGARLLAYIEARAT